MAAAFKILACCAKNLLLLDLGMALGFATIVIPALSGQQPDRYPNEAIHFTPELASWFGTIMVFKMSRYVYYICVNNQEVYYF